MKYVYMVVWLVILPALLLVIALKVATPLQQQASSPPPAAPALTLEDLKAAEAKLKAEKIERRIEARRAEARWCVERAMRTFDAEVRRRSTLIILSHDGCGEQCDTEAEAARVANEYVLDRLHVVMIRTSDVGVRPAPLGVLSVVISDCAPLVRGGGDDYLFRTPNGEISSSGERHEARLRGADEDELKFELEPVIRRGLGLSELGEPVPSGL